jgi:hypothetical protein
MSSTGTKLVGSKFKSIISIEAEKNTKKFSVCYKFRGRTITEKSDLRFHEAYAFSKDLQDSERKTHARVVGMRILGVNIGVNHGK